MNATHVANYFLVLGCQQPSKTPQDSIPTKLYSYPEKVQRYEDSAIQLLSMPSGITIRESSFEPVSHNFIVTRGNGSKYHGSCVTLQDTTITEDYYISKCIVLISDFPFYSTLQSCLSEILKLLSSPKPEVTLESYIYNLINTVTLPNNDCILRMYTPTHTPMYCILPSKDDLPVFQLGYLQLCRFLNPSNLIKVITCILLEHCILIQSDNIDKLNYFCESLSSLIYPFIWTYPYVPILPSPSLEFLDVPLPFIIGWVSQGNSYIDSENFSGAYCRINLSSACVEFSEHNIPQLPFSEQFHNKLTNLYNVHLLSDSRSLETSEEQVSSLTELMSIVEDISNIRVQSKSNKRENLYKKELKSADESVFIKEYVSGMDFDCKVRNLFYSLFLNTFSDVAKFIIKPNSETMLTRTFDKISFLSEKTAKDREFLALFFETQMFTKFIDDLIDNLTTQNNDTRPVAELFISHLTNNTDTSNLTFPVGNYNTTCDRFISRVRNSQTIEDISTCKPDEISENSPPHQGYNGVLPDNLCIPMACGVSPDNEMNSEIFDGCFTQSNSEVDHEFVRNRLDYPHLIAIELSDLLKQASLRIKQLITHHVSLTLRHHYEPDLICSDTDRILIGHRKYSSFSVEDKGVISNLIDALENIWRHGCSSHTDGSYIWEHILAYKQNAPINLISTEVLPALDTKRRFKSKYNMTRSFSYSVPSPLHIMKANSRRGSVGTATNPLITEVQHILNQDNIITDIGRVRMWIKLLFEKQSLSTRVKELLTLTSYIQSNYHKSSFLRTDTELEQLLYHLDSLSCVEFSCFTHDFPQSELNYSATLSISKTVLKHTSVLWIVVSGTLGRTDVIKLSKGSHFCNFNCRNIGHILGVRVGHDNGGLSPDVFINNIKIINNLTGNLYFIQANKNLSDKQKDENVEYYFPARKFLSRQSSIDSQTENISDSSEGVKSRLQGSIRDIIHYFTEPRLAVHSLTYLVLGEDRFIPSLVDMLMYELNGTKNSFTQLWTYFSHILIDMKFSLSQSVHITSSQSRFINTFGKLEDYNSRSGPMEKIYVFLITSLSHQILHEWIEIMSESAYKTSYYKENAFLLNSELRDYMYGAIATLRSYKIPVDLLFTLYID